jgi:hypothetical protein
MNRPLKLTASIPLCALLLGSAVTLTRAQQAEHTRPRFVTLAAPAIRPDLLLPPAPSAPHPATLLHISIMSKLGIPYRYEGTDDRGYDCSGFVWRVFSEAGFGFDRTSARALWQMLPIATTEEETQFGTLVFFNGLGHVGIVRDAFTFYHASRSQGIVLSRFAGYWERRLDGFRRAPMAREAPDSAALLGAMKLGQ